MGGRVPNQSSPRPLPRLALLLGLLSDTVYVCVSFFPLDDHPPEGRAFDVVVPLSPLSG